MAKPPANLSLVRGYAVWIGSVISFVGLFFVQLLVAHEPSYCKGCETSSIPGFLIIDWGMTHMLLIGIYLFFCKMVLWKSIGRLLRSQDE
jgi:hypothetical protein